MSSYELFKGVARALVPASLLQPVVRRFFRVRWSGDFATWAEASARSRGYAAPTILAKVASATRRVRDGRAAYERDGCVFPLPADNGPVWQALERAAQSRKARLSVLDFGGSLGSVYWQHRRRFTELKEVRWTVVEQPNFVRIGRTEFSDATLRFAESMAEACADSTPDVLLLSSVLPYLEDPYAALREAASRGFSWVVIDRTGLVDRSQDRITVQHVPRSIYPASYPCRFFNRDRLLAPFSADYTLVAEYPTTDGGETGFEFGGFVLERNLAWP